MGVGLDVTILLRPLPVTTWHSAALESICQRLPPPQTSWELWNPQAHWDAALECG